MISQPQHTYNVSGKLPDGTYVSITVQAPNSETAIANASAEEPKVKWDNVVRTLKAPESK